MEEGTAVVEDMEVVEATVEAVETVIKGLACNIGAVILRFSSLLVTSVTTDQRKVALNFLASKMK